MMIIVMIKKDALFPMYLYVLFIISLLLAHLGIESIKESSKKENKINKEKIEIKEQQIKKVTRSKLESFFVSLFAIAVLSFTAFMIATSMNASLGTSDLVWAFKTFFRLFFHSPYMRMVNTLLIIIGISIFIRTKKTKNKIH